MSRPEPPAPGVVDLILDRQTSGAEAGQRLRDGRALLVAAGGKARARWQAVYPQLESLCSDR
eukprot:COSAG06_NODE_647_length_13449_cov_738.445210_6_plen_62_part_00